MALTGSDQHITEGDSGLKSEQIPRQGAVKKHVRATSRWLSTTPAPVCAIVAMRCSIWMLTLIDELHNAATQMGVLDFRTICRGKHGLGLHKSAITKEETIP